MDEFWLFFFGGMGCVTGKGWLDFGGDPDHDADPGIFKRNFLLRDVGKAEMYLWWIHSLGRGLQFPSASILVRIYTARTCSLLRIEANRCRNRGNLLRDFDANWIKIESCLCIGMNTGEPPKLGSAGIPLSWDGRRGWVQDTRPSPHVRFGCSTTKGYA